LNGAEGKLQFEGGYTSLDAVSRRLELLKLEGLGFSQAEIVKELSLKCACSKRTVYSDFEGRAGWQPVVQSVLKSESVLLKVVNRYEQIYRQASIRLPTSSNELAQLVGVKEARVLQEIP
jgi:hypothetical protein